MTDLDSILAPLGAAAFLRDTWERAPRHLQMAGRRFDDLLAARDLDALLQYGGPMVRVVYKGLSPFPITPQAVGNAHFVDALHRGYRDGATLAVQSVEKVWPSVGRFCAEMSAWFSCPVGANLYLTPPQSQGFGAHHDTHDVFVLQVAGRKVWRLYGSRIPLPLAADDSGTPADACGPVLQEVTLEEGDVLYLPRGVVHDARCVGEASTHLTVGVYVYRVVDLLTAALQAAAVSDVTLRRALPVGLLRGEGEAEAARAMVAAADVLRGAALESALDALSQRFSHERPVGEEIRFAQTDPAGDIELDTELRRVAGISCRVDRQGEMAAIEFLGTSVRGPAFIESSLRYVAGKASFRPRHLPDELDDDGKLVLARRLVREGLLRPVPAARAAGAVQGGGAS